MSRRRSTTEERVRRVEIHESSYPPALRHTADPPKALWLRGCRLDFSERAVAIAIVGARDASARGLAFAAQLASGLAARGVTVVSGLARGIDAAAHRGALDAGGDTVAVLGCGIDVVYPRRNADLHREILECGCVVSEFGRDAEPRRGHFPRRNRIISGLSLGVVVVEATERSGSLVTARHAAEQGREVFAVPGIPGAPRSQGPHALLKRGAKLVERVEDVLEEFPEIAATLLPPVASTRTALPGVGSTIPGRASSQILEAIAEGLDTVDAIARRLTRQVPEIWSELLDLELRGEVARGPGGRFVAGAATGGGGSLRRGLRG
jgi:DNA processing protein